MNLPENLSSLSCKASRRQILRSLRGLCAAIAFAAAITVLPASGADYVIQPGPADSKDIWTTSVYSYAPGGSSPGGGQNDDTLRVGGWGDQYYSLLQFDLAGFPTTASSVVLYLYCHSQSGGGSTMYLDRITQFWDWRTQGTGRDRERLWWADRPAATQLSVSPNPSQGQWYALDITTLYNAWQSGTYPNYGLQFRPVSFSDNNFNNFYSANYTGNLTLRPKLVISAPTALKPSITTPPQSQSVIAGANVTFSVSVSGNTTMQYQWRKDGMNIPGATSSALTLNSVGAASFGGYSVAVQNVAGSVVSALASLSVLTDGANDIQPQQIDGVTPPAPSPGVNSLVVVTHGWQKLGALENASWVDDMAAAIQERAPGWLVFPYRWEGTAWLYPLAIAEIHGATFGQIVAEQHWQHVHLIGHSAGSAFVEAAARKIKEIYPATTIHCTFLDPDLGFLSRANTYGSYSDWSDCYFSQDYGTAIHTSGKLGLAYNVDVSWVDPNHTVTSDDGRQVAFSTHAYPHEFYMQTITNADAGWCAVPFGFPLSKEGGGWQNRLNYPIGNSTSPLVLCGSPAPIENPSVSRAAPLPNLISLPSALNGDATLFEDWFTLRTGPSQFAKGSGAVAASDTTLDAAWLALGIGLTNTANFIQFDSEFTSLNGAEGLLTVYWNTNQIGIIDERAAPVGLQTHYFDLPATITNGLYTLSFRLDSFQGAATSITVTNVMTGFAGLEQSMTLAVVGTTNLIPTLRLTGAAGFTYLLQSSTNLVDWTPSALLLNSNGVVQFADTLATNLPQRFYRALLP